jgi:uncharacterized membrane protein YagU involved in acid resistance
MNRTIKDGLFGVAGGVAGTLVIGQVMGALSKLKSEKDKKHDERLVPEPPTEKLAREISENVARVELSKSTKASLGQAVRWGYGIFWGGVYGLLRRRVPAAAWGAGLPFGVAFGLFGPAVMLPAIGLTPPATRFSLAEHASGLASHYAYAATVEGVCSLCETLEAKLCGVESRTKGELREVS